MTKYTNLLYKVEMLFEKVKPALDEYTESHPDFIHNANTIKEVLHNITVAGSDHWKRNAGILASFVVACIGATAMEIGDNDKKPNKALQNAGAAVSLAGMGGMVASPFVFSNKKQKTSAFSDVMNAGDIDYQVRL